MTRALLTSVYALRAQVDAVVAQIEDALGVQTQAPGGCPKCGASEDMVVHEATIGGPKTSRCKNCGEEWER